MNTVYDTIPKILSDDTFWSITIKELNILDIIQLRRTHPYYYYNIEDAKETIIKRINNRLKNIIGELKCNIYGNRNMRIGGLFLLECIIDKYYYNDLDVFETIEYIEKPINRKIYIGKKLSAIESHIMCHRHMIDFAPIRFGLISDTIISYRHYDYNNYNINIIHYSRFTDINGDEDKDELNIIDKYTKDNTLIGSYTVDVLTLQDGELQVNNLAYIINQIDFTNDNTIKDSLLTIKNKSVLGFATDETTDDFININHNYEKKSSNKCIIA
jgi:hypothetical protein